MNETQITSLDMERLAQAGIHELNFQTDNRGVWLMVPTAFSGSVPVRLERWDVDSIIEVYYETQRSAIAEFWRREEEGVIARLRNRGWTVEPPP